MVSPSWMTLIQQYIMFRILPTDPSDAVLVKKRSREGPPWLKVLYTKWVTHVNIEVLREI